MRIIAKQPPFIVIFFFLIIPSANYHITRTVEFQYQRTGATNGMCTVRGRKWRKRRRDAEKKGSNIEITFWNTAPPLTVWRRSDSLIHPSIDCTCILRIRRVEIIFGTVLFCTFSYYKIPNLCCEFCNTEKQLLRMRCLFFLSSFIYCLIWSDDVFFGDFIVCYSFVQPDTLSQLVSFHKRWAPSHEDRLCYVTYVFMTCWAYIEQLQFV
jgi:hypothetical protein